MPGSSVDDSFEDAPAALVLGGRDGGATLNRAARDLLGLVSPTAASALPGAALFERALAGTPSAGVTLEWRRGEVPVILLVSVAPAGAGVIAHFADVTALSQHVRDLEAAVRLKDELLAWVAHELRTPLTPMLGWARVLMQKHNGNADVLRAAEVIDRNARLQSKLVEDLLAIARATRGAPALDLRAVDLRTVCRAAVEALAPALAARTVQVHERQAAEPLGIRADPVQLAPVVLSLLTRALDITPDGGSVEIATGHDGGRVCLSVAGGPGPADTPWVGWALARWVIERHGGTIAAEAGDSSGRRLVVRFPPDSAEP